MIAGMHTICLAQIGADEDMICLAQIGAGGDVICFAQIGAEISGLEVWEWQMP